MADLTPERIAELEKLDASRKKQYKRQNEYIKNAFDRVSITLPSGTKDKIKPLTGLSINAYINNLVMADLEKLERQQGITSIPTQPEVVPEHEPTPEPAPKIDKATETIEELNARLMAKREQLGIKSQEVTEKDLEPPKKRKPLPWQDIPRGIMSEYLEQKLD